MNKYRQRVNAVKCYRSGWSVTPHSLQPRNLATGTIHDSFHPYPPFPRNSRYRLADQRIGTRVRCAASFLPVFPFYLVSWLLTIIRSLGTPSISVVQGRRRRGNLHRRSRFSYYKSSLISTLVLPETVLHPARPSPVRNLFVGSSSPSFRWRHEVTSAMTVSQWVASKLLLKQMAW